MNEINRLLGTAPRAEFDWPEFQNSESVFLWEAFVTSTAKSAGHSEDAQIAVTQFSKSLPDSWSADVIQRKYSVSRWCRCSKSWLVGRY